MTGVDTNTVDMTGIEPAGKGASDLLEKEVREAKKKDAKKAPNGKYFVAAKVLKCDGKRFARGEAFTGKVYQNLLDGKSIVTKEEAKLKRQDVFALIVTEEERVAAEAKAKNKKK